MSPPISVIGGVLSYIYSSIEQKKDIFIPYSQFHSKVKNKTIIKTPLGDFYTAQGVYFF